MIYKNFQDIKLSSLGMGCMRLPTDANKEIDMAKTAEMVEYAIANGVNYFDTAWGYHGGKSELAMGILSMSMNLIALFKKRISHTSAHWMWVVA